MCLCVCVNSFVRLMFVCVIHWVGVCLFVCICLRACVCVFACLFDCSCLFAFLTVFVNRVVVCLCVACLM